MKKILGLLAIIIFTSSCNLRDSKEELYHFEVLPVETFEVPEFFVLGATHPIRVTYVTPTTCHSYYGFYLERFQNERTIALQMLVNGRIECEPLSYEEGLQEASFNFLATSQGSYTFKFFKGKDENGVNIFEEVVIPVVMNSN